MAEQERNCAAAADFYGRLRARLADHPRARLFSFKRLTDDEEILAAVAASPARVSCPGDCDCNAAVTLDELVLGVAVGLQARPLPACAILDADGDRRVDVAELVRAVDKALNGCP